MTLVELAEAIGTTHPNLSRLERGGRDYTQSNLERIAEALSVSVSDLLFRDPADPTPIWAIRDRATDEEWDSLVRVAEAMIPYRRKA